MVADLRRGIFSELAGVAAVDIYRRNLQRGFVDALASKLVPPPPSQFPNFPGFVPPPPRPEEAKAIARGELKDLDTALAAAIARNTDRETKFHYQELRSRIDRALNPKS
jgi:hypothetical protein